MHGSIPVGESTTARKAIGSAPSSVDSLHVRLRPRWKDQHRAQAVPERVPSRRDRGGPSGRSVPRSDSAQLRNSESCLARWLKIADCEDGAADRASSSPTRNGGGDLETEKRELRKRTKQASAPSSWSRRTRSCAGPRPTSPATSSQNDVPAGPRPRRRHPGRGDLPGTGLLQAGLLPVESRPGQPPGPGGCAPDQRRDRHPPRRFQPSHRIAESFDVSDFDITDAEPAAVDPLDIGTRGGPIPTRSPWRPSAAKSPKPKGPLR